MRRITPALWKAIGNLIDQWEDVPNDVKSELENEAPVFLMAMKNLVSLVETDRNLPTAADVRGILK